MSNSPTANPTGTVFLRPIAGSGIWPDGTQQYAIVHQDVLAWSATTVYALGVQVTGSDGKVYLSKASGLKNVNPTTDGAVHWLNLW